jgi:hypothetical protein
VAESALRTAGRAVSSILKTEFDTDVGRVNAIGVALGFLAILVLGLHAVYMETIARIFPSAGAYEFPVVTVLAIFFGGFLICVVILALLEPLLRRDADH